MKDIGEGTIRRIDWTELTPVVLLLRVFNVSLGLRILAIAFTGSFLTLWLCAITTPLNEEMWLDTTGQAMSQRLDDLQRDICNNLGAVFWYNACDCDSAFGEITYRSLKRYGIYSMWEHPQPFFWLPGFVLIWAFCGGMICRIVALRLTVDESESISNLLLFLRKRGIGLISSLIILSLGILCCFLPVQIAYWLAAVPGLDSAVAILFPIPMFFAFLTVLLALGLAVGWMLLFAAVSTDGSDGFDAISRMFSYIFQRPLHYTVYWFCSGILGLLGFLLVCFICTLVASLCQYIVGNFSEEWVNMLVKDLWIVLVVLLLFPIAYIFAWFWTSSVAIYLLLRRSVDATPFNEVYRVSSPKVRTLPTIKPDERRAPEIKQTEPQS